MKKFTEKYKDKLDTEGFYNNVKKFYIASSQYMIANYPYNDDLLLHAKVLDIDREPR